MLFLQTQHRLILKNINILYFSVNQQSTFMSRLFSFQDISEVLNAAVLIFLTIAAVFTGVR